jgi:hypothetical protein
MPGTASVPGAASRVADHANLLDLTPVRSAGWDEVEGRVIVHRPTPVRRGLRGLVDRFLHQLAARRIRLDDTGSIAWLLIDGRRTAGQVADGLRQRLGESVEPAEERLGKLLQVMYREELIRYRELDE